MIKSNKLLILSLFFVLICCIGAVSATDDFNDVALGADSQNVDTVQTTDAVDEVGSEDNDDNINILENSIDNENALEENNKETELRSGTVNATDWDGIYDAATSTSDKTIRLTGTGYIVGDAITFNNNAIIIGTDSSYITGGSLTKTPFLNSNSNLDITFINVHFKNMKVKNLLELNGNSRIENCTFDNITTANNHNSIVYNTNYNMDIVGCNFTNNHVNFGAVTNYNAGSQTSVVMTVDKCKFINNIATSEPGAINNCGVLTVSESEFKNNYASMWAGAIHTHYRASTTIVGCNFTNNGAGMNGGALYTYSKLNISNSIFKKNWCMASAGGGAIGSSNWISKYDIDITGSTFEENTNNCSLTNETPATGSGGAISAVNSGDLNVHDCTFINNYAAYGQAIAAYSASYENITTGEPNLKIYNNTFKNHPSNVSDTVAISGVYTFNNNTFINCHQANTGTNNTFINCTPEEVNTVRNMIYSKNDLLGVSNFDDILSEGTTTISEDTEDAWANSIFRNYDTIFIDVGEYHGKFARIFDKGFNITIIGKNRDLVILNGSGVEYRSDYEEYGDKYVITFINVTFTGSIDLNYNLRLINCTFNNTAIDLGKRRMDIYDPYDPFVTSNKINFIDCIFKNSESDNSNIVLYSYTQLNIDNCTFENIGADSLISATPVLSEDTVSITNSTFNNVNVNGVIDIGDKEYLATFENNDYEGKTFRTLPDESILAAEVTGKYNITLTLTDAEGHPLSGVDIKYVQDGQLTGHVTTGDNGQVVLTADWNDEMHFDFSVEAYASRFLSYGEADTSIDVNWIKLGKETVITLDNVTGDKNGNVTVTLKNKLNEAVSKVNVTYKVNGVEFNATTDEYGSFVISNLTGDNEIFVNFAGYESFAAVNVSKNFTFPKEEVKPTPSNTTKPSTPTNTATTKVTKKATKITAKKKTFKAKKKSKKYTIVLKAGKKAVKKVKVTLKVGKKTYKATTNSKGKATFKITKLNKKGKYTAVIKFKGNKYYKATSKKVKITVKK